MRIGSAVVVKAPNSYVTNVRKHVRDNRVGYIKYFEGPTNDRALVTFPACAQHRKPFTFVFRVTALAEHPSGDGLASTKE